MPLRETESIVLKSYNLAEADRIVVFFTREFGMIRGVAKGARRTKSKFGSALEPFSEVHLEYFEKDDRELVSIQQADLIRSSFDIASDLERLGTYTYIAELLTTFAPPHDPNETLYRMVRACLGADISSTEAAEAVRLYVEIWVLRLGGLLPDWSRCVTCKRSFSDSESAKLGAGFELHCGDCDRTRAGVMISPVHRAVFFDAQKLAPQEFLNSTIERREVVQELSNVMSRMIANASGREIRAMVSAPTFGK
jgi:DNA repair protein RecO (recombination protein O)